MTVGLGDAWLNVAAKAGNSIAWTSPAWRIPILPCREFSLAASFDAMCARLEGESLTPIQLDLHFTGHTVDAICHAEELELWDEWPRVAFVASCLHELAAYGARLKAGSFALVADAYVEPHHKSNVERVLAAARQSSGACWSAEAFSDGAEATVVDEARWARTMNPDELYSRLVRIAGYEREITLEQLAFLATGWRRLQGSTATREESRRMLAALLDRRLGDIFKRSFF